MKYYQIYLQTNKENLTRKLQKFTVRKPLMCDFALIQTVEMQE